MVHLLRLGLIALMGLEASTFAQETTKPVPDAPKPPKREQEPGPRPMLGYDDGFFLRTPDDKYELTINGRVQVDAISYGAKREPGTDFVDRRNRLEFTGKFPGGMMFHFEPNFTPEGLEVEEAWIGFNCLDSNARFMFGRMKAPFGLEERSPQGNIDFPRFSVLHQFSPAEDHGVFFYGHTPDKHFGYDLAVYNGTGDSDTNSSKDVGARGTWRPFAGDEGSTLEHLQFGVAATYGEQNADVTGQSIESEPQLPVIRFADGLSLDGRRTRVGLESVWYHGPWFAQAELMHVEQDMSLGTDDRSIGFSGGYMTLSHVLTGEDKSFEATRPTSPFDFETGEGRGAWIVAARFSDLRSDPELQSVGFALPGTFTDHIRTASLGLDWVPNEHVILRNALVHTWYSNEVELDKGGAKSEDALMIELQFDF
jgi:phosphate-selective porin OprO/OprP